jgi:hypothetical protein
MLCLHSVSEGYQLSDFLEAQHAHPVYAAFSLDDPHDTGRVPGMRPCQIRRIRQYKFESIYSCASLVARLLRAHPTARPRKALAAQPFYQGVRFYLRFRP